MSNLSSHRNIMVCGYCGKVGHNIKKCWYSGGERLKRRPRKFHSKPHLLNKIQPVNELKTSTGSQIDDPCYAQCNLDGLVECRPGAQFVIDSGASTHIVNNKQYFITYRQSSDMVRVGNGQLVQALGSGSIKVECIVDGETVTNIFSNALHVPSAPRNLISYGRLRLANIKSSEDQGQWNFYLPDGTKILHCTQSGTLFVVDTVSAKQVTRDSLAADTTSNDYLMHCRLGHMGTFVGCDTCSFTKATRKPFPASETVPEKIGDIIVSDVWGPFQIPSQRGSRYYVSFIDMKSRYGWVYFLSHKSEVLSKFKELYMELRNQQNISVKTFRSDGGGEYINEAFNNYLKLHGIKRQITAPNSPQQNGVAERYNRTVLTIARSIYYNTGLPEKLWPEVIATANYLRNRNITSVTGLTPYEALYGRRPTLTHLRQFGCVVFTLIPKGSRRTKFDATAKKGVFVGYDDKVKGYRVWLPKENKLIISRDIEFRELERLREGTVVNSSAEKEVAHQYPDDIGSSTPLPTLPPKAPIDIKDVSVQEEPEPDEQGRSETDSSDELGDKESIELERLPESKFWKYSTDTPVTNEDVFQKIVQDAARPENQGRVTRSMASRKMVQAESAQQEGQELYSIEARAETPRTYEEAIHSPDAEQWMQAMDEEMRSFRDHNVFTLVQKEPWMKIIGGRWVYALKRGPDGRIVKHKARYVAKGFTQRYNIDYKETFAPTTLSSSVKVILSIISSEDLICHQMDVSTAFLHGEIDTDIYMEAPEGYKNSSDTSRIIKLNKGLYGLKQAGRLWNAKIHTVLLDGGFTQLITDGTLYIKRTNGRSTYVIVYVDDLAIAAQTIQEIDSVKVMLQRNFQMKDLGEISTFIGIRITRERAKRQMLLDQSTYILSLLDRFGMAECNPRASPNSNKNNREDSNKLFANPLIFHSAVGGLMWVANNTRPDIAASVGQVAQHVSQPRVSDWCAVKQILAYLKGTMKQGLSLGGENTDTPLKLWVDANWAGDSGDMSNMASRQGAIIQFAGGTVTWYSRLQSTIALSSTEAEYLALAAGIKEALAIRNLLGELGLPMHPTQVFEDNAAVIHMVHNKTLTRNTRHIAIRHHFIRQHFQQQEFIINKVATSDNIADILTKGLQGGKLSAFKASIGVI